MDVSTITERLKALRAFMHDKRLDAFIIPSTDPHLSEYPASCWKSREWLTGFTGSAGTAVVTKNQAALWTDSRYFIQASEQLKDTGIKLQKIGVEGTPTIINWLCENLSPESRVGIDSLVYSASEAINLKQQLKDKKIKLKTKHDPFAIIWQDRPIIPNNPIFTLPPEISGETTKEKIGRIIHQLDSLHADAILLGTLDAVAWTFNIRSNDVEYNPVAVAYGYISKKETVLFIDSSKVSKEVAEELKNEGVKLAEYNKVFDYLSKLSSKTVVSITPNKINYALYKTLESVCKIQSLNYAPVDAMKAVKNDTEIKGFKQAMIRDGVALVKFQRWMEEALAKNELTELLVAKKLRDFRSQQNRFAGESFETIAGYGPHGAIVHYEATEETNVTVEQKGFLLIDSGAQYLDGTTDITRTIAVGETTKMMREDYTNVLKGHIALANVAYPHGTRGCQLDVLARKELWKNGTTYYHGTGHGIGHFLNVHEGPQSIRMEENPVVLLPGMVTSNEPGIYRENEYGIRIENLVVTQPYQLNEEFGKFYHFETITLCPIDIKPIERDMMNKEEIEWLNNYHQMVYDKLSMHLSDEEKDWLKEKTKAI